LNKIIYTILISFSTLCALDFYSFSEALELQKKSGKIIMIDVVRQNCHYCENMDKNVFDNKGMSVWIKQRFIPVKIDLDKEVLPLGLKTGFTPTFFFINKEQELVKTIPGSWNIQDFKDLVKGIK